MLILTVGSRIFEKKRSGNAHIVVRSQVISEIIDNVKIDYIYNKLKYNQIEVCKEMNLEPSDVIWIATTNNSKWNDYKRANKKGFALLRLLRALASKSASQNGDEKRVS